VETSDSNSYVAAGCAAAGVIRKYGHYGVDSFMQVRHRPGSSSSNDAPGGRGRVTESSWEEKPVDGILQGSRGSLRYR